MTLRHKVRINIAGRNGDREPVIRSESLSLRTRLLNWLLGGTEEVLVLRPGRSVTSVEIFQDAAGITERDEADPIGDQRTTEGR